MSTTAGSTLFATDCTLEPEPLCPLEALPPVEGALPPRVRAQPIPTPEASRISAARDAAKTARRRRRGGGPGGSSRSVGGGGAGKSDVKSSSWYGWAFSGPSFQLSFISDTFAPPLDD